MNIVKRFILPAKLIVGVMVASITTIIVQFFISLPVAVFTPHDYMVYGSTWSHITLVVCMVVSLYFTMRWLFYNKTEKKWDY